MSRVAVVTGSNKGIGHEVVRQLCSKFHGLVYLTARDEKRGRKAVQELEKEGLKPCFHQLDIDDQKSIEKLRDFLQEKHGGLDLLVNNAAIAYKEGLKPCFHQLDIDDQKSIEKLRDFLQEKHGGLDLLVNNAAIAYKAASTAPFGEQAENTIRVNYFGTLNVCKELFPLLRPHARVVNLTSYAGFLRNIPDEGLKKTLASPDLTVEKLSSLMEDFVKRAKEGKHGEGGWPNSCYVVSKVGVSALSRIQQREFLQDSRVDLVVNHVHPGYVDTDMSSHKGPLTVQQGAVSSVYAALLPPNIEEPKGAYIWHDKQIVDWVNGPLPSGH
ncbi:unnamed protein product [Darwinula stevensoni]|uniref:carbonyl reductase (NADPH) n=1 Tax=Darwinula stevensoni TaxID=69355 RepID=A0A7R9FQ07_9CRUS|nr:unnamed protein product [Darwinula stevensoni]CAG0898615.1 unnamed protein product [Darwinula stevensoni]